MPLIKIALSSPERADVDVQALMRGGSQIITTTMGKPEAYVMVVCEWEPMLFGGSSEPCAFAELRSLGGLDAETNVTLSHQLCQLLEEEAGITPARVFVHFMDLEREDWGWNSRTFAG